MIARVEILIRKFLRWFNRSEWSVRLLGLPISKQTENDPGLVIIQIDGLSKTQLEEALRNGKMPFLQHLIREEGYDLGTLFSGIPSSTPDVQGELLYGIKQSVPAFSYMDRDLRKIMRMYETDAASQVQKNLEREGGPGLLEGGSSYSNIFSGGAAESHFCPATFGWDSIFKSAYPLAPLHVLILHGWSLVRTGVLMVLEFFLAIFDCLRGLIERRDLWRELKFVPFRVAICILLREMIVIGAKIDVTRGLPAVHINFVGYDEQAHHRGPTSRFAHWTLKGIDDAIKRIHRAARHSTRREYEVWIYSDHGQEDAIPFETENNRTLETALEQGLQHLALHKTASFNSTKSIQLHRSKWLGFSFFQKLLGNVVEFEDKVASNEVAVTAMGPLGHLYFPEETRVEDRAGLARILIDEVKIPLVFFMDEDNTIHAWNASGEYRLPEDANKIFGAHHPFLEEGVQDLMALFNHPHVGDIVISGWRPATTAVTFPHENGTHGGIGPNEAMGFYLVPLASPLPHRDRPYRRALDLREAALLHLEKKAFPRIQRTRISPEHKLSLRVMTYNVHSCIGMDGRISTDRIARIIAQYDPDIVALQELDVGRQRTNGLDQAQAIAASLKMDFHFHPLLQLEEEQYGDAILSRYPMRLIRAAGLPGLEGRPELERRGALWVSVDVNGLPIQVINTHLGLNSRERINQVKALLSPEWLAHPDCKPPVILCGDFNATPRMRPCRLVSRFFKDAQSLLENHTPQRTWCGTLPLGRIDHVFVDQDTEVLGCLVPRTFLTRLASDHLPLIVELNLPLD